uniref:Putative phosphoglycerol transferase n=1 Tax=Erysipelothrix tonsillarum TaxID=38402 RepID=A0A6S6I6M4_9FIRM|nr:putative phosphoglycerol transferase [Erysipelothrix tonsillarum]
MQKNIKNIIPFLLVLSIPFSNYYIDFGFAIKPFMISTLIALIVYAKSIKDSFKDFKIMDFFANMNKFEKTYLLFIILFCSTILVAKYKIVSLRLILGLIIVVIAYSVYKFVLKRVSRDQITRYIYLTGIIFNILSLALYILGIISVNFNFHGNQFSVFGLMLDRNVPRLIGVLSDPNFFAFYNLIFISTFLFCKKEKYRLLWLTISIGNSILTISRSGFMALIVLFVTLAYFKIKEQKGITLKNKKNILYIIICIISITVLVSLIFDFNPFIILINRFFTKDGGSGRLGLISNGLEMLKGSNYVGIGIFNFRPLNIELFNKTHYMHNTLMEVLVEGGPLIFGIYVYSLYILTKMCGIICKEQKSQAYICIAFFSSIIMLVTLSMLINEMFLLIVVVINIFYEKSILDLSRNT